MKFFSVNLTLILILVSCSNAPEMETGEIKTWKLLRQTLEQSSNSKQFIDSRNLLSRKQIDAAQIPVLFVELKSGQNGTLTPYPEQGVGQTWLGADGATITLDEGILKATRGMGEDIMGSSSSIPPWSTIKTSPKHYSRNVSYINGENKISKQNFKCAIQKNNQQEFHEIWGLKLRLTKFEETCGTYDFTIKNIYYLDNQELVRRSSQYHSDTTVM